MAAATSDCDPCYPENPNCNAQCGDTTLCQANSGTAGGGRPPLHTTSRAMVVLLNDGKGHFNNLTRYTDLNHFASEDIAIGDFNEDGFSDIAFTDGANFFVYINNTDGTFQTGVRYLTPNALSTQVIHTGDINGDNHLDLMVADRNSARVIEFHLGNGDGTFTYDSFHGVGLRPAAIGLYDVNADGHIDLIISHTNNTIRVVFGDGSGRFPDATLTSNIHARIPSYLLEIFPWDFNRDGIVDIVGSARDGKIVGIPLVEGTPPSPPPAITPTPAPTLFPEIGL